MFVNIGFTFIHNEFVCYFEGSFFRSETGLICCDNMTINHLVEIKGIVPYSNEGLEFPEEVMIYNPDGGCKTLARVTVPKQTWEYLRNAMDIKGLWPI